MASASARDREHFRQLGRWKYESHRDALREHLALSGRERLIAALQLTLDGSFFEPRHPTHREENPVTIHDHAR